MRNQHHTPESHRRRAEAQANRVLPPKVCVACRESYTPKTGNQLRCPACIEAKRTA
jgi:hypothetical protein